MPRDDLTQDEIKSLLSYDPESGLFVWKKSYHTSRIGQIAGHVDGEGYIRIGISAKAYVAHRLAWVYMTGRWPEAEIDHINAVKADNRWANLREASRWENSGNTPTAKNNSSGFKGIYWHSGRQKWYAAIRYYKKKIHLGSFDTVQDAANAYAKASHELYGRFARTE